MEKLGNLTSKHYQLAKYYTLDEHLVLPEVLFISKRAWGELSPEDQKLLKECSKETVKYQHKAWDEFTEKSIRELEANGVQIIKPDKELFRKAMKPLYEKYPQYKDLINQIQAIK